MNEISVGDFSPTHIVIADNIKIYPLTDNSIKKGTMCSGHYFYHYSKCPDEMKIKYLANNKLPERNVRHNSIPVKKLHPITLEVLDIYKSYTNVIKKYHITIDKLKQVIKDEVPYKGFRWSH